MRRWSRAPLSLQPLQTQPLTQHGASHTPSLPNQKQIIANVFPFRLLPNEYNRTISEGPGPENSRAPLTRCLQGFCPSGKEIQLLAQFGDLSHEMRGMEHLGLLPCYLPP